MSAIDEIKQKIDIAEIIGQYTTLKKAGRNLTALCPFHSEKHPSFFVYPEQQSWHCFGACSTGGDVFSFLMKKEGIDFSEALQRLAQKAGVTLPSRAAPDTSRDEKEEFYQVNEAAALYFNNLLQNSPAAKKARDYIAKRGFSPPTIIDFQLGFSLDSWEALKQYLKEKGYDEARLVTAGLLITGDDGKTHDRFRGKLMIPIRDIRGRVTGFGARVLDDSLPKYVNSPQTPVFDKSGTLYGIDRASASIRKQEMAVIMEGYMDVITAHRHGITNVVASMGTAITETQVNILKKLSRNLVLSLDADEAGEEAMLRGIGYENTLNAEVRVIILPEGQDPDDVIRKDAAAWPEYVKRAVPLVDFTFDKVIAGLDLSTARDKSLAVERLLPIVAEIRDPVRKAHYMGKLARLAGVTERTLETALGRLRPPAVRRRAAAPPPETASSVLRALAASPREEYCLALLLQYPELKEQAVSVAPEYFESSENREIFAAWREAEGLAAQKARLDPAIHEHFDALAGKELPATKNSIEQKYLDCIMELRRKYLRGLAARKSEAGVAEADKAWMEENVAISAQLRELDDRKRQSRTETRR